MIFQGPLQSAVLKFTALGLLMLALSSCSQDPFADQPDDIKNPQPPATKPAPPEKPVISDALIIDTKDFQSFKENVEGKFQISGRMLIPVEGKDAVLNEDYEIEIDNIADFVGASYDKATGVFLWTPPRGTVEAETTRIMTMNLIMATLKGTPLIRNKSVSIFVKRDEVDPEITSVESLTLKPLKEGQFRDFNVSVVDPTALNIEGYRPRLMIVNSNSSVVTNAASMVRIQKEAVQDVVNKDRWNFVLRIDTGANEITKSSTTLSFGLMALSRYGRISAPKAVDVSIQTQVASPASSWDYTDFDRIYFKAGEVNTHTFTVFDPKQEGTITVNFTSCPKGASCKCLPIPADFRTVSCLINWVIDASEKPGSHTVNFTATNKSPVWNDPSMTKQVSRTIEVKAAPPPPSPSPSPTPPQPSHLAGGL